MRSVTSLFNPSLLRRNIRRFWPIWLVYTLIWAFMMPIPLLLELLTTLRYTSGGSAVVGTNMSDYVLNMAAQPQLVMTMCMGVLLAMALFSYLCSARSVGMMHSLPISRKALFITNYLSGLVMMLSTHLAVAVATALVMMAARSLDLMVILQFLGMSCGTALFCYSFGVLCAVFAGQVLAVPVFYGILNFVAIAMFYLLNSFASLFRYGSNGGVLPGEQVFSWLSPLYRLFTDVDVGYDYNELTEFSHRFLEGGGTVAVYAVVGLALTVLAFIVYCRRASESAGDIVAVGWAKPVFKYGVAFCAAFTLGQGFYYMLVDPFLDFRATASLPGAMVCILVAGMIGYYVADMLVRKSFKVFRRWKGALGAAIGLVVIGAGVSLDVTGYDDYLPPVGQVTGVYINLSGPDFYVSYAGDEPSAIEDVYALHAAILENRAGQEALSGSILDEDMETGYVRLEYYMDDDTSVERSYDLYVSPGDLKIPGTVGHAAAKVLYNDAVLTDQIISAQPDDVRRIMGGTINYSDPLRDYEWVEREVSESQALLLYEALQRDVAALSETVPDSLSQVPSFGYSKMDADLCLFYTDQAGKAQEIVVGLGDYMTETLDTLFTAGVLTAEDALAYWDMSSEDYVYINPLVKDPRAMVEEAWVTG